MTARNRFLITAALLCHLLLAPPLVTSQLRSGENGSTSQQKTTDAASAPNTPCARQAESEDKGLPTICALRQEKDGPLYKLSGEVEIHYETYILRADEVTYNADTGEATATGHFRLDGGPNDDHVMASRGNYNLVAETGSFYDVTGTTGLRFQGSRVVLTSTAPFAFSGKRVEKTSPDRYLVYDGTITTCELPHPKWQFKAHKVVVDVGGNATIHHSRFLLHGIPVLYLPYATHPVQRDTRETGFLIPTIGRSSTKGEVIGDSVYWAINRSMDATLGAEYYSKRGWSQRGEFRARPSDTSYVDLSYFGVIDRGIDQGGGLLPVREGGQNARLVAEGDLHGFRGVANIDYLSSFLFRLAFNEVFSQAVNSEVKSQTFLTKSKDGFFVGGMVERYQNFELQQNPQASATGTSVTADTDIRILHAPSIDVASLDHPLWRSPFHWSFDASVGGLARSEPEVCPPTLPAVCTPAFRTGNLLGRFDLNPQISMPLLFRGWSVRPALTLHDTYYTERLISGGPRTARNDPINRKALETTVELRPPPVERIFDREFLGRKWQHVIEPRVVYRYVTGVDNFANILRFDDRDILSNTHELEYGLVMRLYAKRPPEHIEECGPSMSLLTVGAAAPEQTVPWDRPNLQNESCLPAPRVREVATWEVAQKYFVDPTFGGALTAQTSGQRNVFTTTEDLTGIAFVTEPRHLSPIVSRLRVETSERTDTEWDLDYDFQLGRINASTLLANYHVGPFTVGGGDAFLQIPQPATASVPAFTQKFQQFRVALGYGGLNKRGFSAASSFGIDSETGLLQFATAQTTYNWDCCGMTLEYRRFAIANVRNENLFRFTFTLANIGSFGNLRRQERLY
ncbi:MAG: LPS assembly protein LptD [Acidobacteriia bacterium]|nr:LPS assembly protein LptD [Terriglobia bacterium]